jgi:hypothetical protein
MNMDDKTKSRLRPKPIWNQGTVITTFRKLTQQHFYFQVPELHVCDTLGYIARFCLKNQREWPWCIWPIIQATQEAEFSIVIDGGILAKKFMKSNLGNSQLKTGVEVWFKR